LEFGQARLQSGATAEVVAIELGYGDLTAFSRAFTKHFGEPPSAFRKK
jgi:AraC-like DNA-binding protein